jgi:hypothetical protein
MVEKDKVLRFKHERPNPVLGIDQNVMVLLATDDFIARQVLVLDLTNGLAFLGPE